MKINLGSGWKPLEGWVNIDLYDARADLKCDLRQLDFAPATVDAALASHTLEHFTRRDCLKICRLVFAALKPGAEFVVEMPERERCIELMRSHSPNKRRQGAKGMLGGRAENKRDWHHFLKVQNDEILRRCVSGESLDGILPPEWDTPGFPHLYVWSETEFAAELEAIGFVARIEKPILHGGRWGRDMRVVGVKPHPATEGEIAA